jgi:hypothetical protein
MMRGDMKQKVRSLHPPITGKSVGLSYSCMHQAHFGPGSRGVVAHTSHGHELDNAARKNRNPAAAFFHRMSRVALRLSQSLCVTEINEVARTYATGRVNGGDNQQSQSGLDSRDLTRDATTHRDTHDSGHQSPKDTDPSVNDRQAASRHRAGDSHTHTHSTSRHNSQDHSRQLDS